MRRQISAARLVVARLCGADEIVIREIERRGHLEEARRLRSASAFGLKPSLTAVCFILRPCSSVPVRKNTSLPSSRSKRAMASVAMAS